MPAARTSGPKDEAADGWERRIRAYPLLDQGHGLLGRVGAGRFFPAKAPKKWGLQPFLEASHFCSLGLSI